MDTVESWVTLSGQITTVKTYMKYLFNMIQGHCSNMCRQYYCLEMKKAVCRNCTKSFWYIYIKKVKVALSLSSATAVKQNAHLLLLGCAVHGFYIWPRVIGSVCTRWKVIPILGIRLEKKWTTLHRQLSWILRTPSCIVKQADSWRERKKKKHNNQKNNTTPPAKTVWVGGGGVCRCANRI